MNISHLLPQSILFPNFTHQAEAKTMPPKKALKASLSQGETKQVLAHLLNLTPANTDLRHQAIQLSARFAEYEKKQLGNLKDPAVLSIELNKINQTALAIIEKMEMGNISETFAGTIRIKNHKINNTMKNLLTLIAFIIAAVAIYFLYDWYKSEPQNKEPLPALLSAISAFIMFIVAWRYDGSGNAKGGGFFSFNKSTITGTGNTVHQGNQGNPTMSIKKSSIEGNKNEVKQGNQDNPTIDIKKNSINGDENNVDQGKNK